MRNKREPEGFYVPHFLYKIGFMTKTSNRQVRTVGLRVRVTETEKAIVEGLAERSKAKTVSAYLRALALNRPADDRAIFYKILDEQVRMNAALQAAHDCPAKEHAMTAAEDFMLWAMRQK